MSDEYLWAFDWALPSFANLTSKQFSEQFEAGFITWRLTCFPKENGGEGENLSVFLECIDAAHRPPNRGLPATFCLSVRNHLDSSKTVTKGSSCSFSKTQRDWGFNLFMPLKDLTVESGFLRQDGALVISVELKGSAKRLKTSAATQVLQSVGEDLLGLLEDSSSCTADITLTTGGRSFPAHRAILSARCEYFRTLFASGFSDSTSATVNLPDADPDALHLLLRFIYGGVLDSCRRALLKPAATLADRLRLTAAYSMLCDRVMESVTPETLVEDLLWASRQGDEGLLTKLGAFYVDNARLVLRKDIGILAEANHQLLLRLHVALVENLERESND